MEYKLERSCCWCRRAIHQRPLPIHQRSISRHSVSHSVIHSFTSIASYSPHTHAAHVLRLICRAPSQPSRTRLGPLTQPRKRVNVVRDYRQQPAVKFFKGNERVRDRESLRPVSSCQAMEYCVIFILIGGKCER